MSTAHDDIVQTMLDRMALALEAAATHYRYCAPRAHDYGATVAHYLRSERAAREQIERREAMDKAARICR